MSVFAAPPEEQQVQYKFIIDCYLADGNSIQNNLSGFIALPGKYLKINCIKLPIHAHVIL